MDKNNLDSTSIGTSVPQTTLNVGNISGVPPSVVEKIVECNNHAFHESTHKMFNMYNIENTKLLQEINSLESSSQQTNGETEICTRDDKDASKNPFVGVIDSDPDSTAPFGYNVSEMITHEIVSHAVTMQSIYSGDTVIDTTSQSAFVEKKNIGDIGRYEYSGSPIKRIYDRWKEYTLKQLEDRLQPAAVDYTSRVNTSSQSAFIESRLNDILEELKVYANDKSLSGNDCNPEPTTATDVCEENRRLGRGLIFPKKYEPINAIKLFGSFDVNSRVIVSPESYTYNGYPKYQDDITVQTDDGMVVSLLKVPNGKSSTGGRTIAVIGSGTRGDVHLHHEKDGNIVVVDSISKLSELTTHLGGTL